MSSAGESNDPGFRFLGEANSESTMTMLTEDGVIRAAVTGELDQYSAPNFKRHLVEEVADNPEANRLQLDLTEADFIDATTLGILVGVSKRLRQRQADPREAAIGIRVKSGNLAKIFELTGLNRVFEIEVIEDKPESQV